MQLAINNILVNYEILGKGKRETIIILHGWGRNKEEWKHVASLLSEKKRVIILDLPGFGATHSIDGHIRNLYDYSNFLESFINRLGIKKVTLIGHSFGGKLGISFTYKNPHKVNRLVLVDCSGFDTMPFRVKLFSSFVKWLRPLSPILPSFARKFTFNLIASEDYKNAGNLKEVLKNIVNARVDKEAALIKTAAIIIWGENDKVTRLPAANKLRRIIPHSTLRIIWGAGHSPHLEKPDLFVRVLEDYL